VRSHMPAGSRETEYAEERPERPCRVPQCYQSTNSSA
jgi:hypothetical protein